MRSPCAARAGTAGCSPCECGGGCRPPVPRGPRSTRRTTHNRRRAVGNHRSTDEGGPGVRQRRGSRSMTGIGFRSVPQERRRACAASLRIIGTTRASSTCAVPDQRTSAVARGNVLELDGVDGAPKRSSQPTPTTVASRPIGNDGGWPPHGRPVPRPTSSTSR